MTKSVPALLFSEGQALEEGHEPSPVVVSGALPSQEGYASGTLIVLSSFGKTQSIQPLRAMTI